jgi:spore maturation protein CgeB
MSKLKILVFAKLEKPVRSHFRPFLEELGRQADVQVWNKDDWEANYILKILRKRNFSPDFILHYDFVHNYVLSPKVYGLNLTNIPKGVYYLDLQTQTEERREFVQNNGIDLVFSPTKEFFFKTLPELKDKFRWLPFSIDPDTFRDWKLPKDINFLLMGRLYMGRSFHPWYPFREKVFKKMKNEEGFVYHSHIFDIKSENDEIFIGEKYAKEINRAKIFFNCGTCFNYPVRKYFEVPACNTLLIAPGNGDLEELGFKSCENFVECDNENFYDLAMYYLSHDEERNRIARNGHNLVHSRHTDHIRVKEFLNMLKSYLNRGA